MGFYSRIVFTVILTFPFFLFSQVGTNGMSKSEEGRPVTEYSLVIEKNKVTHSGVTSNGMTVNGTTPGPTLEFKEGDVAVIKVTNQMDVETSIHWHGIILPNYYDGVPYLTTPPIKPGATLEYRIPINQTGTYWYHSHTMLQEQQGVFGSIVIHPKEEKHDYDKELVVVISDWTNEKAMNVLRNLKRGNEWYQIKKKTAVPLSRAISQGAFGAQIKFWRDRMEGADIADIYYPTFLTNGQNMASYPDFKPGEKVRLRFINAAASSYFWLDFGGGNPHIISSDGIEVKPVAKSRWLFAIAETYDVLVTIPDGTLEISATSQDGAGRTVLHLGQGPIMASAKLPRPDKVHMMKEMSKMDMKMGAPSLIGNKKKYTPEKLRGKYGMRMNMDGMDHMNMDHMNMDDMDMKHDDMNHMDMDHDKKMDMDHDKMDHSKHDMNEKQDSSMKQEMDHDHMDMDHNDMDDMDHSQMDHSMHDMNEKQDSSMKEEMDHDQMDMDHKDMDEMDHSQMDHSMHDMNEKQDSSMKQEMDHDQMDMDHNDMDKKKDEMDHSQMDHSKHTMSSSDQRPFDYNERQKYFNYSFLEAKENTEFDSQLPVTEHLLNLTGNMNRYVWSINGQPLTENQKIPVKQGEITRFVFNNLTMMHHPMHLHGHFFRVINKNGEKSPLKHTVNVAPMQQVTIEFMNEEEGDWFLHCHVLYHMMSGMTRVVSYDTPRDPRMKAFPAKMIVDETDSYFNWGMIRAGSNFSEFNLTSSSMRNEFMVDGEFDYDQFIELDAEYNRYLNDWVRVYVGINSESEDYNEKNSFNTVGLIGIKYFTPYMFNFDLSLDHQLRPRIRLDREILLFPKIFLEGEFEYRMDFGWVNDLEGDDNYDKETEWMLGANYMLSRNFSVQANYHNLYGWGAGLDIRF